jgi:hypothetical protein
MLSFFKDNTIHTCCAQEVGNCCQNFWQSLTPGVNGASVDGFMDPWYASLGPNSAYFSGCIILHSNFHARKSWLHGMWRAYANFVTIRAMVLEHDSFENSSFDDSSFDILKVYRGSFLFCFCSPLDCISIAQTRDSSLSHTLHLQTTQSFPPWHVYRDDQRSLLNDIFRILRIGVYCSIQPCDE